MLSPNPPTGFTTHEEMRRFFTEELQQTLPPGRFRFPRGHIEQGTLRLGEPLIFIYQGNVEFTALAASDLQVNHDEDRDYLPRYFMVDLSTLRPANWQLRALQEWFNARARIDNATHENENFLGQAWNNLDDGLPATQTLWSRLRGELPPEGADDAQLNNNTNYQPQDGDLRPIVLLQIRLRQGRGRFRDALRRRYGDRCQVTECGILHVLEAAHIHPHRGTRDDDPENGLLLRSDIHTLFDVDLLGIEPENLRVELSATIVAEYGQFGGKRLSCPVGLQPSQSALRERYQRFHELVPAPYQGQRS